MRPALCLVLCVLAAGCFGGGEPSDGGPVEVANETNSTPSFALPEDRGVSAAATETNVTEEGAGGLDHKHDYWEGREQVVLYEGDLGSAIFPLFPNGEGSTPAGVAYLKLPEGKLVYEGAEKLTLVVRPRGEEGSIARTLPPPGLSMQYRTAASSEWGAQQDLAMDTPLEIPVTVKETDMPHSRKSLWNFRFVTDRPPTFFESLNVTLTVYRGRGVVDWPGHPEFYAERAERVVFDGTVTTHQYGFPENGFYEGMEAWVPPEKLISYGTGQVDVYVNVTSFTSTPPTEPAQYLLYAHNATEGGFECCDGQAYEDVNGANDLVSYHFVVPVDANGMDGPYQPASRWGFHLAARIGAALPEAGPVGFTDGATYDITYHMTIIARKAAEPE